MPSFRGRGHGVDRVEPTTAAGRVYVQLKSDILTCRCAPGSMLYEGDLADQLSVSKTPVREALGMLVHEGLVQVRPRRGYVVTEVTLHDVKEIYHIRSLLEPAAARLAAQNATDEQLVRLRRLAESTDEHDYEGRVRHAQLFHEVLADSSGSARLAESLVGALEECQRLLFLGLDLDELVDHTADEHADLLDALERGDGDAAERIAAAQVDEARRIVLERVAASLTSPDPVGPRGDVIVGTTHRSP